MDINTTRAIIDALHDGSLEKAPTEKLDIFGLHVPTQCNGVDDKLLIPKNTWANKDAYDEEAKKLASKFVENFKKY